jgi:PAB1-binding protein PBP1
MIDREKALEAWKENPEVDDLFTDTGELRLWEDPVGWNGYVREVGHGEPRYYSVNTRFDEDEWISKIRCGERAVRDAVEKHIEDPKAGRAGRFVRRCSPP